MGKFASQIRNRISTYERRYRAAARKAIELTANEANTNRSQGGRLPVDTGFLQSSSGAGVGTIPSGPSKQGESGQTGEPLQIALLRWQPNQTFYFGWSAEYARYMEYRYGFVRGAAENWSQHVKTATADAKARIR
jgi:hypothetical protein